MARRATRTIDHQYFIHAGVARVFKAISEPVLLTRWLADRAELDLRTGGRYMLEWRGGPRHEGRVLEVVRGRRLTLTWTWEGVGLRDTRFRLSLKPKGRGTLLRVTHSGFPTEGRWVDLYAGTEWGWAYFAMNLKSVLETGRDLRSSLDG